MSSISQFVVVLTLEHRVVEGFGTHREATDWLDDWKRFSEAKRTGFVAKLEPKFVVIHIRK